ncbi:MAG TPA: M56 family metallopeptidase [Thermoanaerobaculia bacterium]|nr:M56 family metallopeptidase [Thermoanaerobaculia bacterium]
MLANHAIAWMLTYLLHSTLLLGLAWLVSKPLSRWSVAAEETVWKLALVGALFTASLQFAAAGWEPLAGRWGIADLPATSATASIEERAMPRVRAEAPRVSLLEVPAAPVPAPSSRLSQLSLPSVPSVALGLWALGASLLLAVYGASFLRLRQRLRPRPRVIGGTLFSQLRMMALEAGIVEEVRLSCSSRVPVPLALGLRRGEICVPPRALAGLTQEQQEGMLAHELAHLVRRDPFWLTLSHVISAILFFQPLNWVARRRMRDISEMLSDEWAVSRTGRPLSLAGCLAEVAGWSVTPRRALPVPGMADRPSHLAQRIRRLLDETRSPEHPARRLWLGAGMALLVIAVAAAAPAISAARPDSPEPEAVALASLDKAQARELPAAQEKSSRPQARPDEDDEGFEFDEEKFEKEFEQKFEKEFSKFDKEFEFDFEFPYEYEFEFDQEFDFDFDFDYDFDIDSVVSQAMASADSTLAKMDLQDGRGPRYEGRELTEEEQEKLERDIERATREVERVTEQIHRELEPKMEKLSRELHEKFSQSHSGEMEKLAAEMAQLGERMRPSSEEMARLQAEVRKLQREHGNHRLSQEERERIGREAREMAERMRPSEEERQRMRALRDEMTKRHSEMRQKFMAEHRDEIERSQKEMREEIERHMQGVREEVRRSMEQHHRLREDHDRLRERRQDLQRDRQRLHEERRKERDRDRRDHEDGEKDSSGPSF